VHWETPYKKLYNRIVYYQAFRQMVGKLDAPNMDCAEVSGGLGNAFPFRSYKVFALPEHDICTDVYRDAEGNSERFDMVIADQVWEHLDRPYAATKHVRKMLRKGGYFFVCTPFYVRYHAYPVDCSRWSARGLTNLLIECGFPEDGIVANQWGNLQCARIECGPNWGFYDPAKHSLENDPNFPIVSWALARK
jgi:SAM-dependent methyltransferase